MVAEPFSSALMLLSREDVIGGADAAATSLRVEVERSQRRDRQERRAATLARDERTVESTERLIRR